MTEVEQFACSNNVWLVFAKFYSLQAIYDI